MVVFQGKKRVSLASSLFSEWFSGNHKYPYIYYMGNKIAIAKNNSGTIGNFNSYIGGGTWYINGKIDFALGDSFECDFDYIPMSSYCFDILQISDEAKDFISNHNAIYNKLPKELRDSLDNNLLKADRFIDIINNKNAISQLSTNLKKAYTDVLNAVYNQLEQNDDLQDLYFNVEKNIENIPDYSLLTSSAYTETDGLITDASQFSTNAQEPKEGSCAALIDNNTQTFFSSTWSQKSPTDDYHFLQIDLKDAYKQIALKYTKRQGIYGGRGGNPKTLHIYVTNTPDDADSWTDLGTKTCTYEYDNSQTGLLPIDFGGKAYRHVRLTVEETLANGRTNGNLFFYWSELHAYTRASKADMLSSATYTALTEALTKAKEELDVEWATEATYNTLQSAYDAATNEINENNNRFVDFANSFYLTAYSDNALIVPTGVKAAVVLANGDGIRSDYRYNSGDVIPAETGILLQAGKGNSFNLPTTETTEAAPEDNLLHGTLNDEITDVEGAAKYYKLSYDKATGTEIGFYWGATNGGAFMNKAGKAFLALPATLNAAQLAGFSLFDLAHSTITGIDDVTTAPAAATLKVYDLNGRRINAISTDELPQGIYIINGKKVIK